MTTTQSLPGACCRRHILLYCRALTRAVNELLHRLNNNNTNAHSEQEITACLTIAHQVFHRFVFLHSGWGGGAFHWWCHTPAAGGEAWAEVEGERHFWNANNIKNFDTSKQRLAVILLNAMYAGTWLVVLFVKCRMLIKTAAGDSGSSVFKHLKYFCHCANILHRLPELCGNALLTRMNIVGDEASAVDTKNVTWSGWARKGGMPTDKVIRNYHQVYMCQIRICAEHNPWLRTGRTVWLRPCHTSLCE